MDPVPDPNDPDLQNLPELPPTAIYWDVVKETVRNVFGRDDLDSQVDEVRANVETAAEHKPSEERYRFYQTEPYNVAADITGSLDAGTEEQWRKYLDIKAGRGFGDNDVATDLVTPFRGTRFDQENSPPPAARAR
jgi:hypothetical protein